ncbi:MAG: LamG-like jellyroll fold domain-containing protein [Pirellulaceae bacterium]
MTVFSILLSLLCFCLPQSVSGQSPELPKPIASWPLTEDTQDEVSLRSLRMLGNVALATNGVTCEGIGNHLESGAGEFDFGKSDFTITLRFQIPYQTAYPSGDLISQYDAALHRGFHLSVVSATGVTSCSPNHRHLQLGIDDDRWSQWGDMGRPGDSIMTFCLANLNGDLFAGTCEPGKNQTGKVYRFSDTKHWIDLAAPVACNAITAMAVHEGKLFVGTGKYRLAGSSLPESENLELGGEVLRYEGNQQWKSCGRLPGTEAIASLVVYRDHLYASSLYKPAGFFRYEGEDRWTALPLPNMATDDTTPPTDQRVEAMAVHAGRLFASSYDGGNVFQWDDSQWQHAGKIEPNTQTYSFTTLEDRLLVGTWPSGRVYQKGQDHSWIDLGRLGEELEVMGMMVHNGTVVAGSLPSGEVYRYRADQRWEKLATLDSTPDVRYRRVWTMAEWDGQLVASTLPSGKVFAAAAGTSVQAAHAIDDRWHHVAAVRRGSDLELWMDGRFVARKHQPDLSTYDLSSQAILKIGSGRHGTLQGNIGQVQIFSRALSPKQLEGHTNLGR